MLPTLQPPKNDFSSSGFFPLTHSGYFNHEAHFTRTIQSFYSLAKSVVSKASEITNKQRRLILIVDDEPVTFHWIDELLRESDFDFEIKKAITGQQALEIANLITPDLIITGWILPEKDGLELVRKLKASPATRAIPIIMVTGTIATNEELHDVLKATVFDNPGKHLDHGELNGREGTAFAVGDSLNEIRQQRESLHLKSQFVNFLIEAAPNAIFYLDKLGRFLECNKNFERLFRRTKEEIIGKLAHEFLSTEIAEIMEMHRVSPLECDCLQEFEVELTQEGVNKHLLISFVGFGNLAIEGVIGSITDVTEIIRSNRDSLTQLEITHRKEKEKITSSVEKLQSELDFKHREVAMHLELLIHSRSVKEKLIEGVNKLQPFLTLEGKSKLFTLLKQLKWELNEEVDLNIEKRFDETNAGLYSLLERRCPEITKNEKRLCAFLKMNHCASDIAKITDKSLNSINVALARLRTKLRLPNTKDLRVYLNEFGYSATWPH